MTGKIGSAITAKTVQRMVAPTGVNSSLASLTQPGQPAAVPLAATQILSQNVAADLVERTTAVQYPALYVYCEKLVNSLVEKFRSFSGTAQMAIEVRHSQDRLDGLQSTVETYAGAVTQILDQSRGDWSDGMYYAGGYQVSFGAAKHGGKHFTQTAKVTFEIGVSTS